MSKVKWNTEYFIERAKEKHGEIYDYTNSICNNSTDSVEIICPSHGSFYQQARVHIRGAGCPKCSLLHRHNYKSTKEYFLNRVKNKYGEDIDYSKVDYVDSNTKVCIICNKKDSDGIKHGEYWISPHNHILNKGCPKCKIETSSNTSKKKLTKNEFILKARCVHGYKYDYSKVNYINNSTKVCIICPIHGEFWQTPSSHLKGEGCNKCSKNVYDTESFIKKSKEIHTDIEYDYSKVNYINNSTKVCIICPIHGEFWQTPANFNCTSYNKSECPYCQQDRLNKYKTLDTDKFVNLAKQKHGERYDYTEVKYNNTKTKVCIICHKHGKFMITPNKHLSGEGCPKCNNSKLEDSVMNMLDQNNISYIREYSPIWAKKKRYDFCIEDKKILIECQGAQHYRPVDFGSKGKNWANTQFIKNQKRDRLKRKYAKENGYTLLYYTDLPYNEYGEIKDLNHLLDTILTL